MSPRAVWCYTGEDFMGKCRTLALASTRGNNMCQVSMKMTLRYLTALDMTMRNPEAWLNKFSQPFAYE